jgi:hypothetical protein
MLACGLLVGLACSWLGVEAAHPFLLAANLRARNDELEREMLRYRLQNQRAEKEIRALETDQGIMNSARLRGYVLPGEQKLRVPKS